MASIKHLKWLIIPVFAVLLMSHNTYAALSIPVRLVNGNHDGSLLMGGNTNPNCVYVPSNHSFAQNSCSDVDIIAQNFQVTFNSGTYLNTYIVDIPLYFTLNTNNNALDAWLRNLTLSSSDNSHWSIIDVDFQMLTTSNGLAHVYLKSYGSSHTDNTVQFTSNNNYILSLHPGEVIGVGNTSVWEIIDTSVDTQSIVDAIEDIAPAPSAQDIADAINKPEEEASENISNQSADDYEMESANMSSLFSQFGDFISAVNGASVGDCNIPANFNHIDLGILDLCRNPVPDYVQVAVSIVSCMLIAPYLMNIIKRILSIADKIREV